MFLKEKREKKKSSTVLLCFPKSSLYAQKTNQLQQTPTGRQLSLGRTTLHSLLTSAVPATEQPRVTVTQQGPSRCLPLSCQYLLAVNEKGEGDNPEAKRNTMSRLCCTHPLLLGGGGGGTLGGCSSRGDEAPSLHTTTSAARPNTHNVLLCPFFPAREDREGLRSKGSPASPKIFPSGRLQRSGDACAVLDRPPSSGRPADETFPSHPAAAALGVSQAK